MICGDNEPSSKSKPKQENNKTGVEQTRTSKILDFWQ